MPGGVDDSSLCLGEREIRRSLRLNIIAAVFGMVFWWTVSPGVVQLFALRLGAGNFHIAVISAIILVTLPAQLLSSYLVERYRARKQLWMWSSAVSRVMWIPIVLMPFLLSGASRDFRLWYLIIFFFLYSAVINSTVAPWYSWMTDIVPKERSGQFWGQRFAYVSLTSVLMLPLVGLFLDWDIFPADSCSPFVLRIAVGIVAGCLDVLIHRWIPDPGVARHDEKPSFISLLKQPLRDKSFRRFLSTMCYYSIVMSIYRPFIVVVLKKSFGMSYLQILMLSVAALMGSLLMSRVWGFLSDHFGFKSVLKILFLGHGFLPAVLFFTTASMRPAPRLTLLYFAWFVDCCFAAGVLIVQQAFFSSSLPRKNRSMYIAAFYSVAGLLAAAAPLAGGLLLGLFDAMDLRLFGMDLTSYQLLFAVGFFLTPVMVFFADRLIEESALPPHRVIGQMLFGRVMGISRWLNILSQSGSEERRLRSLRKIEQARNPVVANGIRRFLDDPSERIREKTRQALETLSIEGEARDALPMVKRISNPRARREIRRELKHSDNEVRKNAVEKVRHNYRKAA